MRDLMNMKKTKLLQAILFCGMPMVFSSNAQAAFPAACNGCHVPGIATTGVFVDLSTAPNICADTATGTTYGGQAIDPNVLTAMAPFGGTTLAALQAERAAQCGGQPTPTPTPGTTPTPTPTPPGPTPTPTPPPTNGEAATKMFCGICHGLSIGKTQVTPKVTIPGIKPGGSKHMSGNQSASQYARRIEKMQGRGCPVPDTSINSMAKWMETLK